MPRSSKLGSINVEFEYRADSKLLACVVVAGKDLLPCDLNGLSDPYVVVELRNITTGEKRGRVKSSPKYKNLNPHFNFDVRFELADLSTWLPWRLHIELW